MKLITAKKLLPVCIALLLLMQQGCVKDICSKTYTYTYYQPVYKTTQEVRANIRSNAPRAVVNPGKIYIKGNYIYLNEIDKGIHIIDNSNPAAPVNKAFIDLPGNVDIAIKENILYADFYTDLVSIDISNPLNAVVTKYLENVFPMRYYYGYSTDSSKVITDWVKQTKTENIGCESNAYVMTMQGGGMLFNAMDAGLASAGPKASPVGISGSLARFAIINDYMYSVSSDSLKITNVSNAPNPAKANSTWLGWGIETIYPFKDKLFLGAENGMFIYGLQNPARPVKLGTFTHVRSCDPVVADDHHAYVTLHSGNFCQGFSNQLEVLDIQNILSPQLVKTYPMTSPSGLSKDGNLLFICDGKDGLKLFDAANPNAITLIRQFASVQATDVIAWNNIALVVANDGLYQYDYSNAADVKLISKIAVEK